MTAGIHHVVHAVRDLDAAGDIYRRLGFQVSGRNSHPWGTENRVVQLGGSYIEVLSVAAPERIPPHRPRGFSFGAFNRDTLARGEGLSMLALESRDAEADAARFRAAGIGDFDVFHFEREGAGPSGATVKVAFSLAFAADNAAPQAGFFACQEHFPENFWNPARQVHPNSATGIAGIALVASDPERHRAFLSGFTGSDDVEIEGGAISFRTARGTIQVFDPAAFRSRFGVAAPDVAPGMRLAAIRFSVRDIGATGAALKDGAVAAEIRDGAIVVGPAVAAGAALVFEGHGAAR